MGLDNGIVLKSPKSPKAIFHGFNFIDSLGENNIEICYWRKCWGIRREILSIFPFTYTNDGIYYLTADNIKDIRKIIRYFCNQKHWEEDANSIWTYAEFRSVLTIQWMQLWRLEKYLRTHADAICYFYDSY